MKSVQPNITPAFKKKVMKDWHQQIPGLQVALKGFGVERLIGPVLISIYLEVKSDRREYWPKFCIHNLSDPGEFISCTLSTPLCGSRINIHGKLIEYDDSISVHRHEADEYIDAVKRIKEQARLPLESPISVTMIWEAYKKYRVEKPFPFTMPLVQDPALIAAWAGCKNIAEEALKWGYEEYKTWCDNRRDKTSDDDPEAWLETMKKRISDPEALRRITQEEIIKHKLDYLTQEPLLPE